MSGNAESVLGDLLARAQQGRESARNELFARCRSILIAMARAYARYLPEARLDASDLVQQSLLNAYQAFAKFRGKTPGELLAWLRQILENNATDAARRWLLAQKRSPKKEVSLTRPGDAERERDFDPAADSLPLVDKVAAQEREGLLQQALCRLPELYRQVLRWRHLEGLPFAEIARRLNRSRPAAQMLWLRAVKKLRQLLAASPLRADYRSPD
ncbi:ECF RNA polymerase sigma factor SigH [bacterium HR36]|nr:ECF RNA polymerase sigma factor SigH [bacterium HR36]